MDNAVGEMPRSVRGHELHPAKRSKRPRIAAPRALIDCPRRAVALRRVGYARKRRWAGHNELALV